MTAAEAIRRLTALTGAATAAADQPDAPRKQAAYEQLREEALELNRRGNWTSDESIASLLPSLSGLDEIAALEAAYATGDHRHAGRGDTAGVTPIEALLRALAAWATGVRAACEFAEELRGGD
jgi:hypothetical protein